MKELIDAILDSYHKLKMSKEYKSQFRASKTKKTRKNYTARRNIGRTASIAKGRGASKGRKELVNAKSSLDYKMKVSGSIAVGQKERTKITRVSNRAILPGTERASAKINKDINPNGKKSIFKAVKKEKKVWDNIESMKDTQQSKSSGLSSKGTSSLDNKIRYSMDGLEYTARGMAEAKKRHIV